MRYKLLLLIMLFLSLTPLSFASSPQVKYFKGEAVKVLDKTKLDHSLYQEIVVKPEGKEQTITLKYGDSTLLNPSQKINAGDRLILSQNNFQGKITYAVADIYRLPALYFLIGIFFVLIVIMSGKKGIGAILGMLISLGVILYFIVPQILAGNDPLFISILGAIIIMITTIYLAHGLSQRTTVAIVSTALSLILSGVCAVLFVKLLRLSGLGSEDIYSLQQNLGASFNYRGLLLGGIIIGALGALDDVTTTQAATIYTLAEADPKTTFTRLCQQGMIIGKEHIASLVNTLVLAYAGASIGIFFYLHLSQIQNIQPLWVLLNNEMFVEEIVRTLSGSMALIIAVPLTTLLAAFFAKYDLRIK